MKNFKKLFIVIVSIMLIFMGTISINAEGTKDLVLSNGKTVYYKGTDIAVQIPTEYEMQDTYFRGVWVTPLAGSIPTYRSDQSYRNEILEIFDVMEHYNLNALVYHIRTHNDAMYPSTLNPLSSYMGSATTDYLPWIIEECHKRGIEFHAWMNPYRVYSSGGTIEKTAVKYANYPNNPASNASNLLINGAGGVILNPGLQNVRQFIVDTCMEVINKYDIDAIHFDDYFYISDVNDDSTYKANNPDNLPLADWRREQVNKFIEGLSVSIKNYNEANNKYIQLGISPTGIYRNGDGVVTYNEEGDAISSGSKTGGQEHFASYLFSDTMKWINEEWIDYITPQSYWGFSHTVAGYADVMSWWDKVVAKKNVNLYSGMGIYMSENEGSNYSWGIDPDEAPNQILYASTLKNVKGTVVYNYNYMETAYKGDRSSLYGRGLLTVKSELWTNPAILPIIENLGEVDIAKISGLSAVENNSNITLTFNAVDNAKFYIIYRTNGEINTEPESVYKIIGPNSTNGKVTFVDEGTNGVKYNYAVRAQSPTNNLGEASYASLIKFKVVFKDFDGNVLKEETVQYGQSATAPTLPDRSGATFVGWSYDFSEVTKDLVITPKYTDSVFTVNFYNVDGTIMKSEKVEYLKDATPPSEVPQKTGQVFSAWDKNYQKVKQDLDIYPLFDDQYCTVKFVDWDGTELLTYSVKYGKAGWYPENPERRSYEFTGWSNSLDSVTEDIVVTAQYEPIMFTITFYSSIDDSIIYETKVIQYDDVTPPEAPKVEGYEFLSWTGPMKDINFNARIKGTYCEIYYELTFLDEKGNVTSDEIYFWGEEIVYPEAKAIEGWTFIGWSIEVDELPKYACLTDTVTPLYRKNSITVTFTGFSDVVLSTINVTNSSDLVFPEAPVVEGYEFVKWDKEAKDILDDTTVKAIYKALPTFKVIFKGLDNKVISEVNTTGDVSYPEPMQEEGYKFVKWDVTVSQVTSNTVITAEYEKMDDIEITYLDKDGNVLFTETIKYGSNATFDFDVPTIKDSKFIGFSSDGQGLTKSTTIELQYESASGCNLASFMEIISIISLLACTLFIRVNKKN